MKRYKVNYEKMYTEYILQFEASKKYAKSRGGKVRTLPDGSEFTHSTFSEFKIDLISAMEDNPRKGPKSLAKQLAKDEVYETSSAQAKKLAEIHEKVFGEKASLSVITKYRIGVDTGLWEKINQARRELKEQDPTLSAYKINLIIGQEFFGSN